MKLALTEVYEVATFYAHFDVVKEGETPPPPVTVRVCDSLVLRDGGRRAAAARPAGRRSAATCASCARPAWAPATARRSARSAIVQVDARDAGQASRPRSQARRACARLPAASDFDAYRDGRRLRAAARLPRRQAHARRRHQGASSDAGLRGLGGAGFPTGRKWTLVRAEPAPRLMAVNGDEGEPGTFKDRYYLERDPHRFLEGMLIAAWVVEARGRLHLSPRRISRGAADAADGDRQGRSGRARRSTRSSICGAAPAPTSAAKNPR